MGEGEVSGGGGGALVGAGVLAVIGPAARVGRVVPSAGASAHVRRVIIVPVIVG